MLFSDMLVRYASPSGPMCFIAAWTCVVVSVILVVCSLCVFLSICLFVVCVFLSICLFVVCVFLSICLVCFVCFMFDCVVKVNVFYLKVIVLFLGCADFWLLIHVLFSKEYVCCVCDPSMYLGVPSICQMCVFV